MWTTCFSRAPLCSRRIMEGLLVRDIMWHWRIGIVALGWKYKQSVYSTFCFACFWRGGSTQMNTWKWNSEGIYNWLFLCSWGGETYDDDIRHFHTLHRYAGVFNQYHETTNIFNTLLKLKDQPDVQCSYLSMRVAGNPTCAYCFIYFTAPMKKKAPSKIW